ncbi:MAG: gliding motility-associated protein GldE [Flavobacteriaceae bacterium]|nr:gliding motility-associated protein GldE [Bacteroidia bacterium]MBT8287698.1 gliding motility-associated protein GldE [Bacteroidia bacterium]NNF73945.1 gliding motility-associated protein GldE [Flavobacteriaceae bacterium]NNK71694.1 gliding motility-associated protein GldE [Flavobacteriaceae bacterium]
MDPDPPSLLLLIQSFDASIIVGLVLLVVLLICSALISGAEVALFSLSRSEIDSELNNNSRQIEIISNLLDQPQKLLATILVANNFINIAIVLLFAFLSDQLFDPLSSPLIQFIVEVVIVTFLILLFGEILPKVYASRNNIKFSKIMAYPLKVLDLVITPLSRPMQAMTQFLNDKFGRQKSNISVDHLSQALELTSEEDTTKQEQKILKGIVSFGNTDTKQVMRPRIDIFALDNIMDFSSVLREVIKKGYSRIPVFEDNIDNVIGILYAKDLLPYLDQSEFEWTGLMREPFFVPENKKLDDLMLEFQDKKVHLAVVVDEYGGTSGIVSLEDIIEEIVGDISDEFDDEDIVYSKLDENNFVFEGKTALKDFYKIINLDDETEIEANKGEAETLAGFILEISKSFPKLQSKIIFDNFVFTIEAVDKRRIKRVKVTLT